ncbi:C2H2-type zinc finger transcription factor [Phycomyces blakesleeanus NRRL 1555(-)]|uniref:C2H2-type zinc finger transcription factor n=1 Tax=Phycomyces blakesleeanus (strain ATCC 8743b / DSM 1359 / FGSC 10004 / NBRC 33097 / NRRL 1555) TaxID=763407 RepID=A0A162X8M3_PHYB8|nr:C2H2-type zinc finger transcription factor [Phycomyces blakesleeanus NRRL 1555(-)]OAD73235.1 C2H2-type zinc finger transcription factor [Phycomyces blakesleeanus NRRL 1555(-)]|eukprot:XP_018291275.1 C2H2-type zinc finger transcription factor [Phycomyces blakesleeanus NRRL 1555(-)]
MSVYSPQLCSDHHCHSKLSHLLFRGVHSLSHFLYQCPQKWTVWENAWIKYFGLSPLTFDIHRTLFSLKVPGHSLPVFHVQLCQIISSSILALWGTHWSFIFNNRPFQTSSINSKIDTLVSHFSSELDLT